MSLESEFHSFAGDVRQFQGEVLSGLKNMDEHLISVSQKADGIRDDLKAHEKENGAHGVAVGAKAIQGLAPWVAIGFSVGIPLLATWATR